jgi:hypothetical protein
MEKQDDGEMDTSCKIETLPAFKNQRGLPSFENNPLEVGVAGFEPATLWSQTRYANRTALHPVHFIISSGERGIRTLGTVSRTTV